MTKADRIFNELFDGYQALGSVILTQETANARLLAYLDGYADAMYHVSRVIDEGRPKVSRLFQCLPTKRLRKAVRASMRERRQ